MASVGGSEDSLELNVMPMLDIFSIMVVFLLMSYSTDPVNHDLEQNLELPDSSTLASLDEIPAIVVTKSEILINDKKIINITNGDVSEQDLKQGQGGIYQVFNELQKLAKVNRKVIVRGGEEKEKKPGQITLEMDKSHNFKLLKRIMLSGQQAEFITFKFMVAREEI